MKLLTKAQHKRLVKNHEIQEKVRGTDKERDFVPVVKLFHAFGAGTWLLTELDPETNIAFGLAFITEPELGYIDLNELASLTLPLQNTPRIQRDRYFLPDKTLSQYADQARKDNWLYV